MNNIKKFRQKRDLTVRELAKLSDLAPGYISDLENGKSTNPTLDTINKISKALKATATEIFF